MGYDQKTVHDWTVQDVQAWLDAIGLPALKPSFTVNAVAGEDLLELTTNDLCTHLGATPFQARKILNEVGKLTGTRSTSMSSVPSQAYSGGVAQAQAAAMPPTNPVARARSAPYNNNYAMEVEQPYKKDSVDIENSPQPPIALVGYPSAPPAGYPAGPYPNGGYPGQGPEGLYAQPSSPNMNNNSMNANTNVNVIVGNQGQASCGGFQMIMFFLGWLFCIPWYIGAFGRLCVPFDRDVDMCPWIANIVMSVVSIAAWIAIIVITTSGGYTYYPYG